jgi:predicted Zn-dependent peptidase
MNRFLLFITACLFTLSPLFAQPFESVKGDMLDARIYTLKNGLKVYLSVNKNEPRVQTYIAVRAGSKNDPSDATGLAHYLEHMLFKGTDKFGTVNAAKEKELLDKVIVLYDVYKATTDTEKRKDLYKQIDSLSFLASEFAIANEYDKMLGAIGAKGTNAYTFVEQTVYVNDIPSNQLAKWLTIEAERYRNPVMRLFHTELEVVYEEKNRSLDNDGRKIFAELWANLFKEHQYGTQTTIGTIEHLKNPSLSAVINYYNAYYVPNNMAICLAGDFNPDETLKLINEKFGGFASKPVPPYAPPQEKAITSPIVKTVVGPDAESVTIGFRFNNTNPKDHDVLTMCDMILSNGQAGLIDLNLNQTQKVLTAGGNPQFLKDYSIYTLSGRPRGGQSVEEVKDLLLEQLALLKQGQFPEWLLAATINDLKLRRMQQYESNAGRANEFVEAFILGEAWERRVNSISRLEKISKKEIAEFAAKNFGENYVVVYKKTGVDSSVQKVVKPPITPVKVNRDAVSPFVQTLLATPAPDIQPVFVDYKKDIEELKTKSGIPVFYTRNNQNGLFELSYVFDMGTASDKRLAVALPYLEYLGTSKLSPAQVKEEFYKLGCSFSVSASEDELYVRLSGLQLNFEKGLKLFEDLLADAQPNADALSNLVQDILKQRANSKLNKGVILQRAMVSYAKYGATSPFTNILTEPELNALSPAELVTLLKSLTSYQHRALFYGPATRNMIVASLDRNHKGSASKPVPATKQFAELPMEENQVYFINYDMKQAEIVFLTKDEAYTPKTAAVSRLFNEYYGTNMSGIVFQELRESRALAYSTYAVYQTPSRKDRSSYVFCYIGAQADKLQDAVNGMMELNNNLPEAPPLFETAKGAVMQQMKTERVTKADVLYSYERAKKLGLDYDVRKDVYEQTPTLTMDAIKAFHAKHFKNRKYAFLVIGNEAQLDFKVLEKLGKVQKLSIDDVFGEKKTSVP